MRRHRIYKGRHCEQPKHGGCADGREGALDLRGKGRRVALLATVWALSAMLVILLPGRSGFALAGAAGSDADGALTPEAKPPTQQTLDANEQVYALLDFDNTQELDFAQRGLIAAPASLDIIDADGHVIWSQSAYAFLEGDAPGTVNALFQALLQKGVIVRTGEIFGYPTKIRVSVGLRKENSHFIAALKELLFPAKEEEAAAKEAETATGAQAQA